MGFNFLVMFCFYSFTDHKEEVFCFLVNHLHKITILSAFLFYEILGVITSSLIVT